MTNPNDSINSFIVKKAFLDQETQELSISEIMQVGLTKREYFAAMAMQGLITNGWNPSMAETCVKAADALINALNQDNE